jgi:hypothetical protein
MSDFSVYTAEQITDWMSQGSINTAPADLYITVFDDTGTELDGSLSNARAQTSAGTDWNEDADGTGFENANLISLGEATASLSNIQEVGIFDSATGGNLLARYTLTDAPFDLATGSSIEFKAGELAFDVIDRTE